MIALGKTVLSALGIGPRVVYQSLSAWSLRAAIREQRLTSLCDRLRQVVPDVRDHYTGAFDAQEYQRYWEIKMRGLQAFQVRCMLDALEIIEGGSLVVADIGDSSGNHSLYIRALAPRDKVSRLISVNLDPVAVGKVRAKGGEAVLCRAEDLASRGLRADLVVSFETIEHLTDPLRFLHSLATEGDVKHLLFTVPYRRTSRFGSYHLQLPPDRLPDRITPEELHIFELSPEDWMRLIRLAGYREVFSRLYLQYPRRAPMRLMAPIWRKYDYEGFLGVFAERDLRFAEKYTGW